MPQDFRIVPYIETIDAALSHYDVPLNKALKSAGVSPTTYYRARKGANLGHVVAQRIMFAIKLEYIRRARKEEDRLTNAEIAGVSAQE